MPEMLEESAEVDVFVHVPKTAGTSLRSAVVNHYGPKNVWIYREAVRGFYRADLKMLDNDNEKRHSLKSYTTRLPAPLIEAIIHARSLRATPKPVAFERASAIIGHFTVDEFNEVSSARPSRTFTVVREPLERMVSHYRYVRQHAQDNPLIKGWKNSSNPSLPFAAFALDARVQNFQTSYTGTDPSRFDQIGVTENIADFMQHTGLIQEGDEAPKLREAVSPILNDASLIDPGFRREFAEFHSLDYTFYVTALGNQALAGAT